MFEAGSSTDGVGFAWLLTEDAAEFAAAELDEPELSPPIFGAATVGALGTPDDVPPAEMLSAFRTLGAAISRFPVAWIPASPASTAPWGAIKVTFPGGTP